MKSTSLEICASVILAIVRMKSSLKRSSHQGRTRLRDAAPASFIGGGASGLAGGTMSIGRGFGGGGACSTKVAVFIVAVDRIGGGFGAPGPGSGTVAVFTVAVDKAGTPGLEALAGGAGGGGTPGMLASRGRIGGSAASAGVAASLGAASTETTSSGAISIGTGGGAAGAVASLGTVSTETTSSGAISAASDGLEVAGGSESTAISSASSIASLRGRAPAESTASRGRGACASERAFDPTGRRGSVARSSEHRLLGESPVPGGAARGRPGAT